MTLRKEAILPPLSGSKRLGLGPDSGLLQKKITAQIADFLQHILERLHSIYHFAEKNLTLKKNFVKLCVEFTTKRIL